MIYFEHCLRDAGVHVVSTACVLGTPGTERIARDLRDEILDVFPAAVVHEIADDAPVPTCDLLIAILDDPYRFPLHDVVYDRLAVLDRLAARAHGASYVMVYRARWRTCEVVPAAALRRRVRQLKMEHRLIGLLERPGVLRRLLRPLYGQGN